FSHQTDEANDWLNQVGKGTFRIGYCHVMTPTPLKAFYDPLYKAGAPLNFIMAGHCHWAGNTHSIKDYPTVKITHSTYPLREVSRKAPFNLYKVDLIANKYEAVGDSIGAQEGVLTASDFTTVKLKLSYSKANDGSNSDNTATIVNKFNFPITDARVRFVVPKGSPYYVRNATITQEFDGTNVHVIDAVYNLEPNATTVVTLNQGIQVDLCPNDPNKMDPGLCGCGVPEGSCPIAATSLIVNATTARLVLNTTRQLKATILPTNTTNKTVNWVSSNPAVATINSDGVVNALSVGNTTITASTYDASKVATSNITILPATNTYQAEDADYSGPLEVANQPGYNGTGFLDYTNTTNDYIKWNVYVPADGTYSLTFRYALTANRPLKLTINDIIRVASVSFPITGAWSTWGTYTSNQALNEGSNSIMLTAIGSSGGNFDELSISGNGITALKSVESGADGTLVRIYPNPLHTNTLSIDMVGFEDSKTVEVKILNLLGQTVFHENTKNTTHFEKDTEGLLQKSIYLVSIESGRTKIARKLIVN
ncbi:MAG: Ig-like domain-containing protein, partial [Bacteroidia bacterium]|nr:Ig-like domain-containing protein [Bacteroidia bacterium]